MPIRIKYADDETYIQQICEGEWTLPELRAVYKETRIILLALNTRLPSLLISKRA